MPLVVPIISGIINANLAGNAVVGISSPQLALAVATGFVQYVLTGITINTIDVGTAGSGAGTGVGFVLPTPTLIGTLTATFTGAGINGIMKFPIVNAIANGISQSLLSAFINTVHVGVGAGTGKASIVPNSGVSIPLMVAGFTGNGLVGISSRPLAVAIAQGIDQALPTATGQVVIVGGTGPSPATGTGFGKIT
jgi:hypothetical protein